MPNPLDGQFKHVLKTGTLPSFLPSWIEMLVNVAKDVFVPVKIVDQRKHARINDGLVACKCKKCGQRLPKSEMVITRPNNPAYLLAPDCAARIVAKKERLKRGASTSLIAR